MDLSLQHYASRGLKTSKNSFNPCFNGSFTSTVECRGIGSRWIFVSILVLMDLSLQLVVRFMLTNRGRGFNPCFNGSFTSTNNNNNKDTVYYKVSILVLMDLSLQRCGPSPCNVPQIMFQSLF